MKKLLNKILNFFLNDWEVKKIARGIWDITHEEPFLGPWKEEKRCTHEIQYSKLENRFKLISYGYKPYEHPIYAKAIDVLEEYRRGERK